MIVTKEVLVRQRHV